MAEILFGNSLVLLLLVFIPMIIVILPPLLTSLQDEFPSKVKGGDPFFILFSPYLDRSGIEQGESSEEIMKRAIKTGVVPIADRMTKPALTITTTLQNSIKNSLVTIREAIDRAITMPMRGLYKMSSAMTIALNATLGSVLGSVTGLFQMIRRVIMNMLGMAVTAMNLQISALNTLYSSIGFFMTLVKAFGAVIIAISIPMMFSLFLIPLAITLMTLGSVMVNVSLNSERVLPKDKR